MDSRRSMAAEQPGYTRSYLACRIGHWVPIWQPLIGYHGQAERRGPQLRFVQGSEIQSRGVHDDLRQRVGLGACQVHAWRAKVLLPQLQRLAKSANQSTFASARAPGKTGAPKCSCRSSSPWQNGCGTTALPPGDGLAKVRFCRGGHTPGSTTLPSENKKYLFFALSARGHTLSALSGENGFLSRRGLEGQLDPVRVAWFCLSVRPRLGTWG
jgi:hypothetical protein